MDVSLQAIRRICWPIRPADEIYNAKPQKRGREHLVNNAGCGWRRSAIGISRTILLRTGSSVIESEESIGASLMKDDTCISSICLATGRETGDGADSFRGKQPRNGVRCSARTYCAVEQRKGLAWA